MAIRRLQASRRAFTLVEMLVALALISGLIGLSAYSFTKSREGSVLAMARNSVLTYARLARNYALAHQVETMMVVNPVNGRFELWHLNPPAGGGPFDPLSSGTAAPFTDGYAFAPIFDMGARLPVDGNDRPLARVNPIDFSDDLRRPWSADSDQKWDNLTWAAFCFDRSGKLVIRTRRIATRTYYDRFGAIRNVNNRNRLIDGSPDLAVLINGPMVVGDIDGDTPITSTHGFVISRAKSMEEVLGPSPTTVDLVNGWLMQTRPGGQYSDFAETVLLNRYSGDELAGGV